MRRIAYSSRYHDALVVGPSPITGRGLFAGCAIPRRAKIGEFEGEVIPLAEARRRATGLRIVAIVELDRTAIDARGMRTGFRFIN
ncbi:MAG TPA: SET domain-containing protein, partial [Usitatibacteraceae bacterium]|nr:SET domain-containing protein [Usitatibacteraceae bacterium]